jgi:hypothetical protein
MRILLHQISLADHAAALPMAIGTAAADEEPEARPCHGSPESRYCRRRQTLQ